MIKENKAYYEARKRDGKRMGVLASDVFGYIYYKFHEIVDTTGLDLRRKTKKSKTSYWVENSKNKCVKTGSFQTCMDFMVNEWKKKINL